MSRMEEMGNGVPPSTYFPGWVRYNWLGGMGMSEQWKRYLAALLLSVVLPRAMVHLGSSMQRPAAQGEPVPTTRETAAATQSQPPKPIQIPVMKAGSVVERMELEEYVRGVVLAEMPAYFEIEALKAQAIAARTYALRRVKLGDRHSDNAVCTESTCCQAWMSDEAYLSTYGTRRELEKIAAAVEATASLVLTFQGELAETTYFSCSGGQTEDALAVWGEEIPYLQSVVSPGEEKAGGFSQTRRFSPQAFSAALGRTFGGDPTTWLGAVTKTPGGGVETMVIGGVEYSGTQLRKLLSLNSTSFTMWVENGTIVVSVRGKGHRVGLSQYGADAMAATGCRYETILTYYYRGAEIDKLSDMQ